MPLIRNISFLILCLLFTRTYGQFTFDNHYLFRESTIGQQVQNWAP